MGKSHILIRKINQVEPNQYEEIIRIHAPNGRLSGILETVAITHVLKKDAEMLIQVDKGDVQGGLLNSSISEYSSSDLSLDIPFHEELVIKGKNCTQTAGSHIQYWVVYNLDEGERQPQRTEKTVRYGVEYEKNWFKTKKGVEYSVEIPVPLEKISQTTLKNDTVFGDDSKISGIIRVFKRRPTVENGGEDISDESNPTDVFQLYDQQHEWELEPFEPEERPELSVTIPGSSREVICKDGIAIEYDDVENWRDVLGDEEIKSIEGDAFSFEFDRYETKIPNYQGPLEITGSVENAENLPAIVYLV